MGQRQTNMIQGIPSYGHLIVFFVSLMVFWSCDSAEEDALPAAHPPLRLHADHYTVAANASHFLPVFTNDTVMPKMNRLATQPKHGTLKESYIEGSEGVDTLGYLYTPHEDFMGADSFTYTLYDEEHSHSVDVQIEVVAPACLGQAHTLHLSTSKNTSLTHALGETGAGCPSVDFKLLQEPQGGQAQIDAEGQLHYTPYTNFLGQDSLQYLVSNGQQSNTAWVYLEVSGHLDNLCQVQAQPDRVMLHSDQDVFIHIKDNDKQTCNDQLPLKLIRQGNQGTAQIEGQQIRYHPQDLGLAEVDTLIYTYLDPDQHTPIAYATVFIENRTAECRMEFKPDSLHALVRDSIFALPLTLNDQLCQATVQGIDGPAMNSQSFEVMPYQQDGHYRIKKHNSPSPKTYTLHARLRLHTRGSNAAISYALQAWLILE